VLESTVLNSPIAYRAVWERKPALRAVYTDIYRRILAAAAPGTILEVGGGSGNFKAIAPGAVSSDILFAPWLDIVCDAQRLPFPDGSFSNVVMFDVLHHIEHPVRALREACRVLRKGGRLILCEPAITPVSGLFYRLFHAEPVDMSADPLTDGSISVARDPYDSNQAIPTLLVGRFRERLVRIMPDFPLQRVEWFSFLAYPLSGGFQPWSLVPAVAAGPLLRLEWSLRRVIGRLAAFRLLAVYEKRT
jgi:SAM-dependent methyltransferase